MENTDISTITLESACALLLVAIAYKIYRVRCASKSKCCGDHVSFESENPGADNAA